MAKSLIARKRRVVFEVIRDHPGLTIPEITPLAWEMMRQWSDPHRRLGVNTVLRIVKELKLKGIIGQQYHSDWFQRHWFVIERAERTPVQE